MIPSISLTRIVERFWQVVNHGLSMLIDIEILRDGVLVSGI